MADGERLSRRELLERAGTVAAAGAVAPLASGLGRPKGVMQNDKIVLGLIGCGGMGSANMRSLWGHPEIEVAAICDVDGSRITGDYSDIQRKYNRAPAVFTDYRRMLERKDIDAVIIGTPDHWHALNLIHACEAGKDIYCEKPISHNLVEAVAMTHAAKKYKRVVQVGTWQRSTREFTSAIEYIRSGQLGKIVLCRAWISDGTRIGRAKPSTPPDKLNYDMWLGPAAFVPYQSNIVHWNWRWMMNTGGGLTTDWGVHMMDIALLGMSKDQDLVMPTDVAAFGGQWAIPDDDRTAPDTIEAILNFENPDFAMHWSVNRDHPGKPGHGTEFVSADGKTLRVWRGGWVVLDADGKEIQKQEGPPPPDHWRDWIDCMKTRSKPRADLASVAQTTICCHLVNAALYSGGTVRWNNRAMDIEGKTGKQTMAYRREYRKPWTLTMHKS